MTDEQRQAIKQDAEQAAKDGKTPNERCPHPFSGEQGKYWVKCYWAMPDRRFRFADGSSRVIKDKQ